MRERRTWMIVLVAMFAIAIMLIMRRMRIMMTLHLNRNTFSLLWAPEGFKSRTLAVYEKGITRKYCNIYKHVEPLEKWKSPIWWSGGRGWSDHAACKTLLVCFYIIKNLPKLESLKRIGHYSKGERYEKVWHCQNVPLDRSWIFDIENHSNFAKAVSNLFTF